MAVEPDSGLLRLPLEIRENIYTYLLAAKSTKVDIDSRYEERYWFPKHHQIPPDYAYAFYTNLLATNTQIRNEGVDFLIRENLFVSVALSYGMEINNVPLVAEGACADTFSHISMKIDLQANSFHLMGDSNSESRHVILAVEDLPALCSCIDRCYWPLHLTVESHVSSGFSEEGYLLPRSSLARLLSPLQYIYGLSDVEIFGPIPQSQKAYLKRQMCRERPSAEEVLDTATAALEKGDGDSTRCLYNSAIQSYKFGLDEIRHSEAYCNFREADSGGVLSSGCYAGMWSSQAKGQVGIHLHGRVAAAYTELGKFRIARKYISHILQPLRHDKNHFTWFNPPIPLYHVIGLKLEFPRDGNEPAYAELLIVAARISFAHGYVIEAGNELAAAEALDPSNSDIQHFREIFASRTEKLRERHSLRHEARDVQRMKWLEKILARYNVARKRRDKANEALRNGFLDSACALFEEALVRIEKLRSFIENYNKAHAVSGRLYKISTWDNYRDETKNSLARHLQFEPITYFKLYVRVQLANIHMKRRQFEEAHYWADGALAICLQSELQYCGKRDWMRDADRQQYKAYKCKLAARDYLRDANFDMSGMRLWQDVNSESDASWIIEQNELDFQGGGGKRNMMRGWTPKESSQEDSPRGV